MNYITKPVDVSVVVARVKTQLTVKRLLDERKNTIAELEKAETLRAQLFRIASHDLKTPLNNISNMKSLLIVLYGQFHLHQKRYLIGWIMSL